MKSAISTLVALVALSAFGQSGPTMRTTADVVDNVRGSIVGTVTSVMETRNQFVVTLDDDRYGTVTVQGDSLITTFRGFGGTINGAPEVFQGSTGMANLREGDHVEVRGIGAANTQIKAEEVILLGRNVAADPVGVGQTRAQGSLTTPTANSTARSDSASTRIGSVEGIVREINSNDNSIVVQTDRREMVTVRGTGSTPVYYRKDVYHIANLEVGDRVRISPESATTTGDVRAHSIEVVQNVQEPSGERMPARGVGQLSGRVSGLERHTNIIRIQPDTGRTLEVPVDLSNTLDENSRPIHSSDVQVGDRVTLSGSYNANVFVASTLTIEASGSEVDVTPPPSHKSAAPPEPGIVTIYGTVSRPLSANSQLTVTETTSSHRTVSVYASADLVVRGKTAGYTVVDRLKPGDGVVVKAYRDASGNFIAQTIRLR